jgi:hypothetical protein
MGVSHSFRTREGTWDGKEYAGRFQRSEPPFDLDLMVFNPNVSVIVGRVAPYVEEYCRQV